ncbi:Uncharacterised protein [uncultured archaeon]|nr:Uncharacterised protein [uncultured archaeon]
MIRNHHERKPYDTEFDAAWKYIQKTQGTEPYWTSKSEVIFNLLKVHNSATERKTKEAALDLINYIRSGDVQNDNANKAEQMLLNHCDEFVKRAIGTSPRLNERYT